MLAGGGGGPGTAVAGAGTTASFLRAALAFLALLAVAPLLAWVYGLGSFATWYWLLAVPSLATLVAATAWLARRRRHPAIVRSIAAGALGGLIGTAGYDLVRLPFHLAGLRVLAPIDSYGLLLTNATSSSGWTGTAGWVFHTTNGVCFGVAFALVLARRHVGWAIGWAMVLETATVVSPFLDRYGLAGKHELIVLAYGAHVPYGLALGLATRDPDRTTRQLGEIGPRALPALLGATALGIVLWQRPWSVPEDIRAGRAVAPGPSAVVRDGRFSPAWLRVPRHGCYAVRNDDDGVHHVDGSGAPLPPGVVVRLCPSGDGTHRVKLDGRARSGGFVIVDPEAA